MGSRLRQACAALMVMCLHGLCLWAWNQPVSWEHASAPDMPKAERILVSLPPLAQPLSHAPKLEKPNAVQEPNQNWRASQRDRAHAYSTSAVVSDVASNAKTEFDSVPTADSATAPSSTALNLILSHGSLKSLAAPGYAAQSAFQGRLPDTVERQVANAFAESGSWAEERIDYDHIRFRRGNTCYDITRPEAARINPMDSASTGMPWLASKPYQCR